MSFYALYGTGYNQLARMATAATPEGADSLYPIANLYNGQPWKPFRFATAGGSGYIDFDLNQVVNGEFGTAFSGGLPGTGWGKSSGATLTKNGSSQMEVTGGAAEYGYYDLNLASGEVLTFDAWLQNSTLGAEATIKVRNLTTGNWLTTGAAWQAAETHWALIAASSLAKSSVVTIEPYTTTLSDRCTVRMFFYGYGSGTPTYDDVLVYPRINFASVHGHNVEPNTAPVEIRSGAGSPAATTQATFTLSKPTMFSTFSSVDARYWRLFFTADPLVNPTWIGELVLGQYQTLMRRQNFGQDVTLAHGQDRDGTDMGPFSAYVRQELGRRRVSLKFRYDEDTEYEQAREIVERSKGGAHPLVLVIESGDETMAMLGRIAPEWTHSRVTNTMRDASLEFEELPFPMVLP